MKALGIAGIISFLFVGCGPQGSAPQKETGYSSQDRYESQRRVEPNPPLGTPIHTNQRVDETQKAHFLKSIRDADPNKQTIQRALMNGENELGIVLSRGVAMDDIPKLMKSLLTRMASDFPGQDLTIVAYGPSDPPVKIGTGRLDARTRELTYTPARR